MEIGEQKWLQVLELQGYRVSKWGSITNQIMMSGTWS
jgi:hypothetical protein